jgi:ABC-type multidrug transport system fused ATPase/permease subunit
MTDAETETETETPREPGPVPPPRSVARTGDDTPARSLARYVWRMSGWHQVCACLLAVATAAVGLAPIELQRRLVDDAIAPGDARLLLVLVAFYAGALLAERLLKFALGMYQGWLGESAVRYTRAHLAELYCARSDEDRQPAGRAISVIGSETDKLGGYVGDGPSRAAANASLLAGILAYMAAVEPRIAGFALLFLVPQVLVAPLLQRRLNRLTEARLGHMRALSDRIAEGHVCTDGTIRAQVERIYANRMRFVLWKQVLKGALNLLNAAGPLAVLGLGGWLAIRGETTVGTILAFVSGFQRLADPVRELISFYRQSAQARVQHDMIARWM